MTLRVRVDGILEQRSGSAAKRAFRVEVEERDSALLEQGPNGPDERTVERGVRPRPDLPESFERPALFLRRRRAARDPRLEDDEEPRPPGLRGAGETLEILRIGRRDALDQLRDGDVPSREAGFRYAREGVEAQALFDEMKDVPVVPERKPRGGNLVAARRGT